MPKASSVFNSYFVFNHKAQRTRRVSWDSVSRKAAEALRVFDNTIRRSIYVDMFHAGRRDLSLRNVQFIRQLRVDRA